LFNHDPPTHHACCYSAKQARRDGQAARTQLQLAAKAQPSLIERYFIFAVSCLSLSMRAA